MEIECIPPEEKQWLERILLRNMRRQEPELHRVLQDANRDSSYEDGI